MEHLRVLYGWIVGSGIRVVAVLAVTAVANMVLVKLATKASAKVLAQRGISQARKKRLETLSRVTSHLITIGVWGCAGLIVLDELKIKIGPLLAGAGVAGLAVGFGAQNMVRDYLSGFLILLENQFGVGDVIKIGDVAGLVESMSLRITVLRDLEGKVHIVPNGEIKVVTNMTKQYAWSVIDVGISYKENVDRVMELMKEVGDELRADRTFGPLILEPMEMLGVEALAESQVTLRCRFKTPPIRQWDVAREYRLRLKKAFDREGIEIPFPHRTVYIGRGRQGTLPITKKESPPAAG